MLDSRAVTVVGAGVAGTWQALLFAKAGFDVTVVERGDASPRGGGRLLGRRHAGARLRGRDGGADRHASRPALPRALARAWGGPDGERLARRRPSARPCRLRALRPPHRRATSASTGSALRALEPALAGRFREGLFFPDEAHVEPRHVLPALHRQLEAAGATIRFNEAVEPRRLDGTVIDCRGLAARDVFPDLRGVRGEIVVVETREVALSRPVRLIHPRWPLYIVPRPEGRFLIGATTDRERGRRRGHRALRPGTPDRRLCGASRLRRGAHRRAWGGAAAGLSRTMRRASASTAATSPSTGSTGTASCWRPPSPS